ncbi:MAG: hypothetical protein ACTSXL_01780, partial [Alphaproteobacteria bacterium]
MKPLKENYREFENWNLEGDTRFVYFAGPPEKPVVDEGAEKEKKKEEPKGKPKITDKDTSQQDELSKKRTDELTPSGSKEKDAAAKRKTALKESGENLDKKKVAEKERHDQEEQKIEDKAANLIAKKKEGELEKKPAKPEEAKEVSELIKNPELQKRLTSYLGLKPGTLTPDMAKKMLATLDPKKLKKLEDSKVELKLTDEETKAMGGVITENINKLGKDEKNKDAIKN